MSICFSAGSATCDQNANCENTIGSYKCTCKVGFIGDGYNCIDENECTSDKHQCDPNADCKNTVGAYICSCRDGFQGDGYSCTGNYKKPSVVFYFIC